MVAFPSAVGRTRLYHHLQQLLQPLGGMRLREELRRVTLDCGGGLRVVCHSADRRGEQVLLEPAFQQILLRLTRLEERWRHSPPLPVVGAPAAQACHSC